jgi:carboxypeptidase C (cathepsin A)
MTLTLLVAALLSQVPAPAAEAAPKPVEAAAEAPAAPAKPIFTASETRSRGSVTVGGRKIAYQAVAGTLVIHGKDWDDTKPLEEAASPPKKDKDEDEPAPEASMFYAAYFKDGAPAAGRPITFLFNGGPGSSTVWLHMGAFGPVRVQTADTRHTPAAPYAVVNNDQSLLDATDLVFVDAPGTGSAGSAGKDKDKAFYGVDQDIDAFTQFITQFLSKYRRWNSPKYIFRRKLWDDARAGLALALQNKDVDLNGVILLSDILAWDLLARRSAGEPGQRPSLCDDPADLCGDGLVP